MTPLEIARRILAQMPAWQRAYAATVVAEVVAGGEEVRMFK
jgi:phage terminase large subunit-like protein